ncbi:MAG: glycosyltransferase family 61 protein [Deltaproteobacteria bacterium]|nr:glycosyltransferase family 61 protein [Deltaproteobacteria bacterium]
MPTDTFRRFFKVEECPPGKDLFSLKADHKGNYDFYIKRTRPAWFKTNVRTIKNALLMPFVSPRHVPPNFLMENTVYDARYRPVYEGNHYKSIYRGFTDHPNLPSQPTMSKGVERIRKKAVYFGAFQGHYGHFIIETLSRMWPLLERQFDSDEYDIVFNLFGTEKYRTEESVFNSYYGQYLFDGLGIPQHQVKFLRRPSLYNEVFVPTNAISLSNYDCFASAEALKMWHHINTQMSKRGTQDWSEKIYITRAHLTNPVQGRRLVNEDDVEQLAREMGYSILIPEELPNEFEKQKALRGAKIIMGCPGSGLLNSIFAPVGTKVISVFNLKSYIGNPAVVHQICLNHFKSQQTFMYAEDDLIADSEREWSVDIDKVKKFMLQVEEYQGPGTQSQCPHGHISARQAQEGKKKNRTGLLGLKAALLRKLFGSQV